MADPSDVWCGPDKPSVKPQPSNKQILLNSHGTQQNVYLKFESISKRLVQNPSSLVLDMLEVASYIYCADQAISRGGKTWPRNGQGWNRTLRFHIPVRNVELWNSPEIVDTLVEGLSFLSDDNYDFVFRKLKNEISTEQYFDFDEGQPWFEADSVLLFSGGLDSLAGAVDEIIGEERKVILVSHRPASQIYSRQKDLVARLRGISEQKAQILHVPVLVNKLEDLTRDVNQRTRSFLYASLAAAVSSMSRVETVRFYENGIVSCNLPLAEQVVGARASRSTHPRTIQFFSDFFSALTGKSLKFENPYFWKTKSEVVKVLVNAGCADLILDSKSCTHTQGTKLVGSHCGVCSQCFERRIATMHNDLPEFDPPSVYHKDFFTDRIANGRDRAMLESCFLRARRFERITPDEFVSVIPEVLTVARSLPGKLSYNVKNLFEMHMRYAQEVATVVNRMISDNAEAIRLGNIDKDSMLATMTKNATKSVDSRSVRRFPTPDGCSWADISIDVVSSDSVVVRAMEITNRFHAFDLGFRDNRKMDLPNSQWSLLCDLAECCGKLDWGSKKSKPGIQKRFQALGKTLCSFFGIEESPFYPYRKSRGYELKLKIKDSRQGRR